MDPQLEQMLDTIDETPGSEVAAESFEARAFLPPWPEGAKLIHESLELLRDLPELIPSFIDALGDGVTQIEGGCHIMRLTIASNVLRSDIDGTPEDLVSVLDALTATALDHIHPGTWRKTDVVRATADLHIAMTVGPGDEGEPALFAYVGTTDDGQSLYPAAMCEIVAPDPIRTAMFFVAMTPYSVTWLSAPIPHRHNSP